MNDKVKEAETFLNGVLRAGPAPWYQVQALLEGARALGIDKSAIKLARKELRVISLSIAGEQHWAHPDCILLTREVPRA